MPAYVQSFWVLLMIFSFVYSFVTVISDMQLLWWLSQKMAWHHHSYIRVSFMGTSLKPFHQKWLTDKENCEKVQYFVLRDESSIPGASLPARKSEQLTVPDHKQWLSCRGCWGPFLVIFQDRANPTHYSSKKRVRLPIDSSRCKLCCWASIHHPIA